ncbi:MAG: ATP-binding protein [Elusimicrobia bacterium]|nr:ATP-binding protein [Elusimicrobiota bacterium]
MPDALSLSIRNVPGDLALLEEPLDAYLRREGACDSAAYALRLALEELLTNRIKYGFRQGEEHRLDISLSRLEDGAFRLAISDDGDDFNPCLSEEPDGMGQPLHERGIGGLGLHMVRQMSSSMSHRRENGRNTLVVTVQNKEKEAK